MSQSYIILSRKIYQTKFIHIFPFAPVVIMCVEHHSRLIANVTTRKSHKKWKFPCFPNDIKKSSMKILWYSFVSSFQLPLFPINIKAPTNSWSTGWRAIKKKTFKRFHWTHKQCAENYANKRNSVIQRHFQPVCGLELTLTSEHYDFCFDTLHDDGFAKLDNFNYITLTRISEKNNHLFYKYLSNFRLLFW